MFAAILALILLLAPSAVAFLLRRRLESFYKTQFEHGKDWVHLPSAGMKYTPELHAANVTSIILGLPNVLIVLIAAKLTTSDTAHALILGGGILGILLPMPIHLGQIRELVQVPNKENDQPPD
jgi:hypothetical protein